VAFDEGGAGQLLIGGIRGGMEPGESEVLVLKRVDHLVDQDAALIVALDVVVEVQGLGARVVVALDAGRAAPGPGNDVGDDGFLALPPADVSDLLPQPPQLPIQFGRLHGGRGGVTGAGEEDPDKDRRGSGEAGKSHGRLRRGRRWGSLALY